MPGQKVLLAPHYAFSSPGMLYLLYFITSLSLPTHAGARQRVNCTVGMGALDKCQRLLAEVPISDHTNENRLTVLGLWSLEGRLRNGSSSQYE
jgi:hypothetical protein